VEAGIDVVNDGETGKADYATYVASRLTGFGEGGESFLGRGRPDLADYPRYWKSLTQLDAATGAPPVCVGPVAYVGHDALAHEIDTMTAAMAQTDRGAFLTAASPGVISRFMPNRHYPDEESYLAALAEAMKAEYDAIVAAGFVLQLDCPDLTVGWNARDGDLAAHRRYVAQRLEALDHATRDIPPDRMRLHICWGNYEGPHHHDIPLRDVVDLLFAARPDTLAFEGANPRHEHEWAVFGEVEVPPDAVLMPGVIDTTTHYIEHPELVAQRIARYVERVGPERVLAATDCGFATFAAAPSVDPDIAWAKLGSLVAGAALASRP
jgi:5-methyltetrahydropteroyltriglutamate--homocysteine methyltransferase